MIQKNKAPFTSGMVNRAKSNKTKSILAQARHALLAIVLSPVYQTAAAGAAAVGTILLGVLK